MIKRRFRNLTVKRIDDALSEYSIVKNYLISCKGEYRPEAYELHYNPTRIDNIEDFHKTLLHEISHVVDDNYETNLNEIQIEDIAQRSYKIKVVRNHIEGLFNYEELCDRL